MLTPVVQDGTKMMTMMKKTSQQTMNKIWAPVPTAEVLDQQGTNARTVQIWQCFMWVKLNQMTNKLMKKKAEFRDETVPPRNQPLTQRRESKLWDLPSCNSIGRLKEK